jgi:hypothetical protein
MNESPDQNQAWLRVGVASELVRQYNSDSADFFQSLAILLEAMLPNIAQIEKRGGLFSKKKPFRITIPDGENRLVLEEGEAGVLRATHTRIVKGIALKTEDVSMQEWLEELSETL